VTDRSFGLSWGPQAKAKRLAQIQAQTIGGAAAKAAVLQATVKWDQVITDEHDIVERVIAPIVADLQWLAARNV
jgi:hypothetical protein